MATLKTCKKKSFFATLRLYLFWNAGFHALLPYSSKKRALETIFDTTSTVFFLPLANQKGNYLFQMASGIIYSERVP